MKILFPVAVVNSVLIKEKFKTFCKMEKIQRSLRFEYLLINGRVSFCQRLLA